MKNLLLLIFAIIIMGTVANAQYSPAPGVASNAPITGATKTKITYDSKGLVTSGADIGASDLPSGIDAAKLGNGSVSNTEYQRLDGVSSAIQTQLDSKFSSSNVDTDSTFAANSDSKVPSQKAVKSAFAALPVGVTNGAGADVVPVSNGTNLRAGRVTDVAGGAYTLNTVDQDVFLTTAGRLLFGDTPANFIDINPAGLNAWHANPNNLKIDTDGDTQIGSDNNGGYFKITAGDVLKLQSLSSVCAGNCDADSHSGTATVVVNPAASVITNTAANSFSVVSPLFGAGSDGTKFRVNGDGRISAYDSDPITNGQVLIGDGDSNTFRKNNLTEGTGISFSSGAGSLTITNTQPGAAVTCSNTAASTAITGTASKTYFNLNCLIPADTLSAGKTIKLEARGVYSSAVANTLVNAVDLCTVSGCASGTVVNLATTAAVTPGAITNQGWLLDENGVIYDAGATGHVDVQGYAAYQTASLVITFDPTPNTATATIATNVDQYLSVAVTWSTNSGSNSITLRNWKVVVQ